MLIIIIIIVIGKESTSNFSSSFDLRAW